MKAYKNLEKHASEITALQQIRSLLNWDKSVMMPEEGVGQRARQLGVLALKIHGMESDSRVGEWIAAVNRAELDVWQAANLAQIERMHCDATAVPAELVALLTEQEIKTEAVWRGARRDSDYQRVVPDFSALVGLVRESAAAKAEKMRLSPYDALMEPYVPGMRSSDVDLIFDDMSRFLPGFIGAVLERQKAPLEISRPVPIELQEKFGRQLAGLLGFDFKWGRLDVSTHPFSSGIGGDVRITTRYIEDDFMKSIRGVTHEAGHAFYDRHVPAEWRHQPAGSSMNMGMAIHESQSLSLDMQLGRSREYWEFLSPHLQKTFGVSGPEWSGENLYRLATRVERGFIRVDADEVTYPAHIILRYRLERAMIEGRLDIRDLPEAWNAQMKELIGVTPPNDRLGCLQDIHWYSGSFGYFPAYALGAMIAAQLVDKMKQDIPGLFSEIQRGNFSIFVGWLRDRVQSKACLYTTQDLIQRATGRSFSTDCFKKHLTERYLGKDFISCEGESACLATSAPEGKRRA